MAYPAPLKATSLFIVALAAIILFSLPFLLDNVSVFVGIFSFCVSVAIITTTVWLVAILWIDFKKRYAEYWRENK